MKCELNEYEGCFSFDIEAETKEEVVKLARFGIGKMKDLRSASAHFLQDGTAGASVVIGKKKSGASGL